jgi:predicted RecA/RadA family phage recombinase
MDTSIHHSERQPVAARSHLHHLTSGGDSVTLSFEQGGSYTTLFLPGRMAAVAAMIAEAFNAHIKETPDNLVAQGGGKTVSVLVPADLTLSVEPVAAMFGTAVENIAIGQAITLMNNGAVQLRRATDELGRQSIRIGQRVILGESLAPAAMTKGELAQSIADFDPLKDFRVGAFSPMPVSTDQGDEIAAAQVEQRDGL